MILGTRMVLYDYHHGILNRMFSQETITDVHLYLDKIVSILTAVWLETLMRPICQL